MENKEKFYITTAIAYSSRKPHIGNTYDVVLADAIARYKRIKGYDVYFLTGSDEHGQKIEQEALTKGVTPKEYVDAVAAQIKQVWDCLNLTYDRFIRTTDSDHEEAVKKIFKKLYDKGDIYKSEYSGKYCVPCESFFTESQLVDGKCPDCGREVNDAKEEAYFLRLSKYQDKLLEYYNQNPDFFKPDSRRAEMVNNFIKPGLADLCVSRSSFKWGIPVEFDDKHVIYVWIDALSNYITGIGYNPDGSSEQYKRLWPADLHVIGKDIVRFHTIYWPIILMALGEPLPKQVLGHPWLLFGEDKMSKSKGNIIYADELVERFGADAVRYYLLSEMPFAQDGTITYENFISRFNTDLANTLGNLVNRTVAMTNKYFGGSVLYKDEQNELDDDLFATADICVQKYFKFMDTYKNADAVESIMTLARRCNKYIDETTPWVLAKDPDKMGRLENVLCNLLRCIKVLGAMLSPITPECSQSIKAQINSDLNFDAKDTASFTVGEGKVLFARLDTAKVLAELEADMKAKQEKAKSQSASKDNVVTFSEISIDDFAKVQLLTAKVKSCEPIPKAKKLLKLTLDDGSGTDRTVASGIALHYSPEQLIGRTVIVVSNLKPAVLCGVESCGMILAADDEGKIKVIFADDIAPGSKVR